MKSGFFKYEPSSINLKTKIKCFCLDENSGSGNILYLGDDNGIIYSVNWINESILYTFDVLYSVGNEKEKNNEVNYLNQIVNLHCSNNTLITQLRSGIIYFISINEGKFINVESFISTESIGFTKFLYMNLFEKDFIFYPGNEGSEIKAYNKSCNTYNESILSKQISVDSELGVVVVIKKINDNSIIIGLECSSIFIINLTLESNSVTSNISVPKVKPSKFSAKLDLECLNFEIAGYKITPIDIGAVLLDIVVLWEKDNFISICLSFYNHDICIMSYNTIKKIFSKDYFIIKDSYSQLKSGIPTLEIIQVNSVNYLITGGYDYRIRVYAIDSKLKLTNLLNKTNNTTDTFDKDDDTLLYSADLMEWTVMNKASINKLKAITKDDKNIYLIVCSDDSSINIFKRKG